MSAWNRSVLGSCLLIGSIAGCGGDDSADSTATDALTTTLTPTATDAPTTTAAAATTVTPTATDAPTTAAATTTVSPTTTLLVSGQLFVVDPAELQASATDITEVTQAFADSFNGFDVDAAAQLTGPGFRVMDPVYPELNLSSVSDYYAFLSGILDTSETVQEIVVNADGSLTRMDWPTFFRTDPAGFDGPLKAARHLLFTDGKVTQAMPLFEQGDARLYPEEISTTIRLADFGYPLDTSVADITAQADAATDLADRWSAAWTAHDPAAIQALYADTGVRHDEYAGPPRSPEEVGTWANQLLTAYPDLAVTVDEAFSSGVGPAVLADLTVGVNGAPCTVRMGVVWAIDGTGQIDDEDVYYDPATLLACGLVN